MKPNNLQKIHIGILTFIFQDICLKCHCLLELSIQKYLVIWEFKFIKNLAPMWNTKIQLSFFLWLLTEKKVTKISCQNTRIRLRIIKEDQGVQTKLNDTSSWITAKYTLIKKEPFKVRFFRIIYLCFLDNWGTLSSI